MKNKQVSKKLIKDVTESVLAHLISSRVITSREDADKERVVLNQVITDAIKRA